MCGSFREHLLGCRAYCLPVQPAEQVDDQDLEHISRPSLRVWAGAGVQFLSYLLVQAETPNGRGDAQPHCGKPLDGRNDKLNCPSTRRSKIDFNRLPCAGSIPDGYLQAHGIDLLHLERPALEQKAELVES